MVPDPTSQLADGVLVEAQIRARLLGAPILRLDAEIVLAPARTDARATVPRSTVAAQETLESRPSLPDDQRISKQVTSSSGPVGSALARAILLDQQTTETLNRRNGR
jgi:hypothetical protein